MWLYYVGLRRTAASRATLAELAYPFTAAVVGVTLLDAQPRREPMGGRRADRRCRHRAVLARVARGRAGGAGRARAVDDRLDGPPPAAGGVARRRAAHARAHGRVHQRRRRQCGRRPVGHSAKRRGHHGGEHSREHGGRNARKHAEHDGRDAGHPSGGTRAVLHPAAQLGTLRRIRPSRRGRGGLRIDRPGVRAPGRSAVLRRSGGAAHIHWSSATGRDRCGPAHRFRGLQPGRTRGVGHRARREPRPPGGRSRRARGPENRSDRGRGAGPQRAIRPRGVRSTGGGIVAAPDRVPDRRGARRAARGPGPDPNPAGRGCGERTRPADRRELRGALRRRRGDRRGDVPREHRDRPTWPATWTCSAPRSATTG